MGKDTEGVGRERARWKTEVRKRKLYEENRSTIVTIKTANNEIQDSPLAVQILCWPTTPFVQ